MESYKTLSQEKLQCPYCSKIVSLFNVARHLKGKSCKSYKEKFLKVNSDKKEEEFELYVQNLRQNTLHKELNEDIENEED
jgi:hypothetical protein